MKISRALLHGVGKEVPYMSNEMLTPENEEIATPDVTDEIDGCDFAEEDIPIASSIRPRNRIAKDIFDFLEMLVIAACAILFLFSFIARVSVVSGGSMNKTLEDGDRLVVSDMFYTPSRGDIVVFQDLESGRDKAIVKRVIGVGGDTVTLSYQYIGGVNTLTVTVNGEILDESDYRYYDMSMPSDYRDRYQGVMTYVVPEGCVFVMGDNLYNSEDSRGVFGYIEEEKILGRVIFRLMGDDFSDFFAKFGVIN